MSNPTIYTPVVAAAGSHIHGSSLCGSDASIQPTHEEIAKRAYDIYVKTGSKKGHCTRNWQQAERDLRDQGRTASVAYEAKKAPPIPAVGSASVAKTPVAPSSSNKAGRRPNA